jgi:cell division protein ZapA (FtsZ GTPase activity inhibitor)
MGKSNLEVNILGSSFTVQSDGDSQYLRQVVDYLQSKIQEIKSKYSGKATADPIKISLLAGLNIVDELFRCRRHKASEADGYRADRARAEEKDRETAEIEEITERLIDTIDRSLFEN